jgi:phenylacetate-CoA ligase
MEVPIRALSIAADIWRLDRAQWHSRDRLHRLQHQKLHVLCEHAYKTVPFYRMRFREAGIVPADIRSLDELARIPITTRAQLQAMADEHRTSSAFRSHQLTVSLTSGSTGRPFRIYRDPGAMGLRKALFIRALRAAGFRFGDRVLLVANPPATVPPPWTRWRYVPRDVAPEVQLHELETFRPAVLYGMATTLRLLALHLQKAGRRASCPRIVITTGESLDGGTRALLENSFGAPVFDVYGAVEGGTIAWECQHHNGLHIAEDAAIVELVPAGRGDVQQVVLTNLENRGMPLIRYEIGDLATFADDRPCPCGRHFRRLARIEGRLLDCVRLTDGSLVSPYRFEHTLEQVPGVRRFQVIQDRQGQILIRLEGAEDPGVSARATSAVQKLVGDALSIVTTWAISLDPQPGEKFRLVRSHSSDG